MPTTRSRILEILKKQGEVTIDDLASPLGLASMTVRQHLSVLERDDMVASREVRRATGRPHYVYRLTEKGEDFFPKSYPLIADRILQEVRFLQSDDLVGLDAEQKLDLLFQKMADRLAVSYALALQGRSLEEQVLWVAELLNQEGGITEWREARGGFEILGYNCPFLRIAQTYGQLCDFHLRFLTHLFGLPVTRLSSIADGGTFCCYHIEAPA